MTPTGAKWVQVSIKFFIQNSVSRLLFVSIILQVQEQLNDNQILDLLSKASYFVNLSYTKHNLMQPKYTLAGTKVKFQRKMIILISFRVFDFSLHDSKT